MDSNWSQAGDSRRRSEADYEDLAGRALVLRLLNTWFRGRGFSISILFILIVSRYRVSVVAIPRCRREKHQAKSAGDWANEANGD